jgi:hypothetical protein
MKFLLPNRNHRIARHFFSRHVIVLLGLLLLPGCASTSRQTWNSRVGSYSVRQAVKELGPPQKAVRFGDGTQMGEWLTQTGTRSELAYHWGPTYNGAVFDNSWLPRDAPHIPDQYLRLLFGPDGKLVTWDRQYN